MFDLLENSTLIPYVAIVTLRLFLAIINTTTHTNKGTITPVAVSDICEIPGFERKQICAIRI